MTACPVQEEHVNVRSTDTFLYGKASPAIVEATGESSSKGNTSNSELAQTLNLLQQTMDIDTDKDNDDYEDTLKALEKALTDDIQHNSDISKGLQKDLKELSAKLAKEPTKYLAPLCGKDGKFSKEKVDAFLDAQHTSIQEQIKGFADELTQLKQKTSVNNSTGTNSEEAPPPTETIEEDSMFSTDGGTASYVAGAKVMSDLAGVEGYLEYELNDTMLQEAERNSKTSQIMIDSSSSMVNEAIQNEKDYEYAVRRAKRKAHQNSILGHCISAVAIVAACCTCNPVIIAAIVCIVADQEQASIRTEATGKEQKTGMDYTTSGLGKQIAKIPGVSPKAGKLIADMVVVAAVSIATGGLSGSLGAGVLAGATIASYTKMFDDTASCVVAGENIDENSKEANGIRMGIAIAGVALSLLLCSGAATCDASALGKLMALNLSTTAMTAVVVTLAVSIAAEIALNLTSMGLSIETGELYEEMAREQENIASLTASLHQVNSVTDTLTKDTDQAISMYSAQITQIGDSTNGIIQSAANYAFGSVLQA